MMILFEKANGKAVLMRTVKGKLRNIPKEVVVTYKTVMTPGQKTKIEDMVVDLLVAKIKSISRKTT